MGDKKRYEVLYWMHAAEAMWALHGLAILYVRWFQKTGDPAQTEESLSKNIVNGTSNSSPIVRDTSLGLPVVETFADLHPDMNFLEAELSKGKGKFLCGDAVSAADCMMEFSAAFIMARELGIKPHTYPKSQQYIQDCEATETYKKAVQKTGHKL